MCLKKIVFKNSEVVFLYEIRISVTENVSATTQKVQRPINSDGQIHSLGSF